MTSPVTAWRSPFPVIQGSGPRPEHHTLSYWMNRVLEELADLRSAPDEDTIHDLRVAIRRCRSLATVIEEVDPDPAWPQMRKVARKLFRGLGAVRDAQVLEDWVKQLGAEDDPLRAQLLAALKTGEQERSDSAAHVSEKFDTKKWLELDHALRRRIRLVPIGSPTAECLALERLQEARDLHAQALRTDKPAPWHGLRIGLKKFRYTVESLLPSHYAAWSKNLKRLQDLLGDVHDLDVLAEKLSELPVPAESSDAWHQKIEQARRQRVETYRQLTLGKTSLWNEWRQHLPHGEHLEAAVAARLRATARAADKRPRRTTQENRIALRLFDILRRRQAAPLFAGDAARRIMRAAAGLHGVSALGKARVSPKAARKFLLALTVPPNWTADQWDLMAWAIRFQRGAEPEQKNGFGRLTEEQQALVRAVAGTLRLARSLRKTGIHSAVGLRSEKSADAFIVCVPGLPDTAETAGRLAEAKHLLESVLPKPLILKPVPPPVKAEPAAPPSAAPAPETSSASEPPAIAAASD
jgi:CHAD domain-containing protein